MTGKGIPDYLNIMNKELITEIQKRRAYRDFQKKQAPQDSIDRIIRAGHLAPSCFNSQSWRFLIMNDPDSLEKGFSVLTKGNQWARESAFLVAAATRDDLDCMLSDSRNYALFDTGLAVQNMILQAVKEGMTGHPMAGFNPVKLKELFEIPENYRVITLIAFGYLMDDFKPEEYKPRERKPLEEVFFFNRWNAREESEQDSI